MGLYTQGPNKTQGTKMKRSTPSGLIKFAFKEGRHTKTPWGLSASRALAAGAEEALDLNVSRAHLLNIKIAQVNEKGRVIEVFPNLYHAAAFAVETKLAKLKSPKDPKAAYGVYGNMVMCSRMGWKAYGFHWVPVPTETKVTWERPNWNSKMGRRIPTVLLHKDKKLYFLSTLAAVRYYMEEAGIRFKKASAQETFSDRVRKQILKGKKFTTEEGYTFKLDKAA